jgi:Domain of unknown function (DUF4252)
MRQRSTIAALAVAGALMAPPGWALEELHTLPSLDKLAQKATESVDVTLDAPMLRLASAFLSSDDPDQARVKKLVAKLKGVYVRSFEFDREGQYSAADVEAVRSGLKGPGWARIVGVKSLKGENTEVYMKKDGDQVGGVVVIDAEPKELTVVDIDGPIDPEELSELGGHMGIPKLGKKAKGEKGSSKGDQ